MSVRLRSPAMSHLARIRVVAIGEAMVQMAPLGPKAYAQSFAGDTFNTAWHLAQLLGDRADVGFLTRVGTDRFSDTFVDELERDGLDTSVLMRDADREMGLYVIELHGAERHFHYWRSDSAARHLADDPAVLRKAFEAADLAHVSGITLAILSDEGRATLMTELTRARSNGMRICFDPNIRPRLWSSMDEIRQAMFCMMAIVDCALPSFDDEAALWGDAGPEATLMRYASAGAREVVVKNGSAPVHFRSGASIGTITTPPVPDLIDTTGAGDAFNAGFLAARALGFSCEQAIPWGQRLSSNVIRTLGACCSTDHVRSIGAKLLAG